MTLFDALTAPHRHRGDHTFLRVPGGSTWSYDRFDEQVALLAKVLQEAGVDPGDRVLAQVHKSPEALALYLATLRAGAVYVPLNTAYTTDEVRRFVGDSAPRVVVLDPDADASGIAETTTHLTLDAAGYGTLTERLTGVVPGNPVPRTDDDPAAMLYTSGTTGRSKGAVLSHHNLISNARMLHDTWRFSGDDVLLHMLPIFHVHGLFVAIHCAMLSASQVSFHPSFDLDRVITDLHGCTVVMGVPTHYSRLLRDDRLDARRCHHVRLFTSGSAPLTPQVHQSFAERTGHRILERYGMTEAGMITSNPYDGERIAGTVGYPLPGVEVRVVDDAGKPVGPDQVGAVETRGPHVFQGYWGLPDQTGAAFTPDGWLRTGDIGALSADGRLRLEGRLSDMIISGGLNVYPREIEAALDAAPTVIEAAVVGIPHIDLGEAVVAFLVTRRGFEIDDADDALRHLARFKHPKRFVLVDRLPRNAMGKVEKARLRAVHTGLFDEDGRR